MKFLWETLVWFIKCAICCAVTWVCVSGIGDDIIGITMKVIASMVIPNILLLIMSYKNKDFLAAIEFGKNIVGCRVKH